MTLNADIVQQIPVFDDDDYETPSTEEDDDDVFSQPIARPAEKPEQLSQMPADISADRPVRQYREQDRPQQQERPNHRQERT